MTRDDLLTNIVNRAEDRLGMCDDIVSDYRADRATPSPFEEAVILMLSEIACGLNRVAMAVAVSALPSKEDGR